MKAQVSATRVSNTNPEVSQSRKRSLEWAGLGVAMLAVASCSNAESQSPPPVIHSGAQYELSVETTLGQKLNPTMQAIAQKALNTAMAGNGSLTKLPSGEFSAEVHLTRGLPFSHAQSDITVIMEAKDGQPDPTNPDYVHMYNGIWANFSGIVAMASPDGQQHMTDLGVLTSNYSAGWSGYDSNLKLYDTSDPAHFNGDVLGTANQVVSDAKALSDVFFSGS
ncbi:MAG TPA: hypothetical protein VLG92_02570 [Candidatus Saccharimonadia bacterium]|nr:hypothetical protein [Candidatus Saccharimonadia bacterium]